MANGLQLGHFLTNRPAPVQRDTSNPFADLGELGMAIARGRHQSTAEDLQQQHLDQQAQTQRIAQEQQARQMLMGDKRAGQREDLYRTQENRRESQAQFERSKLKDAEHEQLLHQFYAATTSNDPRAIQYAMDALQRAGYSTEQIEHAPPPAPTQPAPYDDTLGGTLQADGPGVSTMKPPLPGQTGALPPKNTSLADKQTAAEPDNIESSYVSKLAKPMSYEQAMAQAKSQGARGVKQVAGGWAPLTTEDDRKADASNVPSKRDAQTSAELDNIEADMNPKLSGKGGEKKKARKYLPGQDIVLGSGDSFNKYK
jgi:hypothetical protein